MGKPRLFVLWLQWFLFRRRSVFLIDHDGAVSARLVHGFRNRLYAKRVGMGIRSVWLLPDGNVRGGCYVEKWEPLFPRSAAMEEVG